MINKKCNNEVEDESGLVAAKIAEKELILVMA